MADCLLTVVGKVAEYTVDPVLRQFGYLIYYKRNVKDLAGKVTILETTRDSVLQRCEGDERNSMIILPIVENWLSRVDQIIQDNEACFEEGKLANATTCCSANQWFPNLRIRRSLSRKATKMAPKIDALLAEGNFSVISCPPPPPKPEYPLFPYCKDPTQQDEAASSSSSATTAKDCRLEIRLPYTKDHLLTLQDDKIKVIGVCGEIRDIDTVTAEVFIKRMKSKYLFEEVVVVSVSKNSDWKRIRGEIRDRLLAKSKLKRLVVVLTDVWQVPDQLREIGISDGHNCKIVLISQLPDVFSGMESQSTFMVLRHSTPEGRAVEFKSRISVVRDVMNALTDDETNTVVIWGMGGVGKTILVKEIGAEVSEVDLFGEVALAVVNQEPNMNMIQAEIAHCLGLQLIEGEDLPSRATKLRDRILNSTKSVLVILDDVWKPINLSEVGILVPGDPRRCKVLVSSRRNDIFETEKNFHVCALTKDDAWSLFKKTVGGSIDTEELGIIAQEVLEECDGLPVAISTVGKSLRGKKIENRMNASRQLKQARLDAVPEMIEDVYRPIQFSYDALESEEAKSCFLLCCVFPESVLMLIEYLVRYGLGLGLFKGINSIAEGRDHVRTLVGLLRARSLLLESDQVEGDEEEDGVRMHDVVRDVAEYIDSREMTQNKNGQFEKRNVLRKEAEIRELIENNDNERTTHCTALTTNTSTELLLLKYISGKLKLPSTIFKGMENLKVLSLEGSHLPSFPIFRSVQTLILDYCQFFDDGDATFIDQLQTLRILSLRNSYIRELPGTFKNLSKLRLLDLTRCRWLKKICPGVISSLAGLEELYVWDCFEHGWVAEKYASKETASWISQLHGRAKLRWKRIYEEAVEELISHSAEEDELNKEEEEEEEEDLKDEKTRWANSMDWTVGILSQLLSLSHLTTLVMILPPLDILQTSKLLYMLDTFKISIEWDYHDPWRFNFPRGNYLRLADLDASSLAGTISLLLNKTSLLEICMKDLTDHLNVSVKCWTNLTSLKLYHSDSWNM